jgi:hypothetical protein
MCCSWRPESARQFCYPGALKAGSTSGLTCPRSVRATPGTRTLLRSPPVRARYGGHGGYGSGSSRRRRSRTGRKSGICRGIYFSIVQRKVINPNDFTELDQIRDRLAAFEIRYNAIARPFNWKFTRTDLADLLHRIDAHDGTQPHALAA